MDQTSTDFDCPSQFVRVIGIVVSRAKEKATDGRHCLMTGFVVSFVVGIQSEHTIRTEFVQVFRLHVVLPAVIIAILHMLDEPLMNVVCLAPICDSIFFGDAHPIIGIAMHGITITAKSLDATLGMLFEPEVHV